MHRFLFGLALVLAAPAWAQEESLGRYQFAPAEGGALRLDRETGAVAFCTGAAEARACTPVPDHSGGATVEASADLEARLAALEARIAALEAAETSGLLVPDDETMDRVMDLTDKMMRRFFGMVRDMKKDLEDETL